MHINEEISTKFQQTHINIEQEGDEISEAEDAIIEPNYLDSRDEDSNNQPESAGVMENSLFYDQEAIEHFIENL